MQDKYREWIVSPSWFTVVVDASPTSEDRRVVTSGSATSLARCRHFTTTTTMSFIVSATFVIARRFVADWQRNNWTRTTVNNAIKKLYYWPVTDWPYIAYREFPSAAIAVYVGQGVPRIFHQGGGARPKGRHRGRGFPRRGSPAGFGAEPRLPRGFPLFSALRMASPDTIILLIVDYHAASGGHDARVPLRAPWCRQLHDVKNSTFPSHLSAFNRVYIIACGSDGPIQGGARTKHFPLRPLPRIYNTTHLQM